MNTSVAWEHELQSWLEPFLTPLRHPARRRMCPPYVDMIRTGRVQSAQSGLPPVPLISTTHGTEDLSRNMADLQVRRLPVLPRDK